MAEPARFRGSDSVLIGLDGQLFECLHRAIDQVAGKLTLSPAQVQRWVSLIESRDAWCRQQGIRHLVLIVPTKHVVYADKVPGGLTVSPDRPVSRLLTALSPDLRARVVYPADLLIEGRQRGETFLATDTHWTDFGAYLTYTRLHPLCGLPPGSLIREADLAFSTFRHLGDLGIRLTPERAETAIRLSPPDGPVPVRTVFSKMTFTWGQVEVLERSAPGDPVIVMFRDSAGSALIPLLARHCRRLVAMASRTAFYDLLRSEEPDIVLTELTEISLCLPSVDNPDILDFPDESPSYDFTGFTGLALPLISASPADSGSPAFVDLDFAAQKQPVWSSDENTEMVLKCPVPYARCTLSLTVSAFVHLPEVPAQRLDVLVNGTVVGSFTLRGGPETLTCDLPRECLFSPRMLRIELYHPDCVSPSELGIGTEERAIAVRLHRLTVAPTA